MQLSCPITCASTTHLMLPRPQEGYYVVISACSHDHALLLKLVRAVGGAAGLRLQQLHCHVGDAIKPCLVHLHNSCEDGVSLHVSNHSQTPLKYKGADSGLH